MDSDLKKNTSWNYQSDSLVFEAAKQNVLITLWRASDGGRWGRGLEKTLQNTDETFVSL